jgi:hypothetical protein
MERPQLGLTIAQADVLTAFDGWPVGRLLRAEGASISDGCDAATAYHMSG